MKPVRLGPFSATRAPTLTSVVAVIFLGGSPTLAHHSSAPFDDKAEITLEGTVTKFEWANPHVYVFLDVVDSTSGAHAAWEIEGMPPAILRRMGMSAEMLAPGDRVTITARPARDRTRTAGLLSSVRKSDGTFWSRENSGEALYEPGAATGPAAQGLTGTWVTLINETSGRFFDEDSLDDESIYPLTEKAKAASASFVEESDLPGIECVPYNAPWIMLIPDVKTFAAGAGEGTLSIRLEFDDVERTVHMNVASHEGAPESLQGHSIGRWEDKTLIVDTSRFNEHRNGITWSVPSSTQKHLLERFELNPDGRGLTYRFELTDPEHLTRPLTGWNEWVYRPDLTYAAEPCDLANARRFVADPPRR